MARTCIALAKSVRSKSDNHIEFEVKEAQEEWEGKFEGHEITYSLQTATPDISRGNLRTAVNLAMTTWDFEIPLKLQWIPPFQEADVKLYFKSPEEDKFFKDRPSVLAYAYFPGQARFEGIVVFNDAYHWSMNGQKVSAHLVDPINYPDPDTTVMIRTYNIIHVLIHEFGHTLGLRHSERDLGIDVMDPFYKGSNLDLSPYDLLRIRQKYGIRQWRWNLYARVKKWLNRKKLRYQQSD